MALATVERLSFAYPEAQPALREVSLTLEPGEAVLVLGRSGSGKSTLLRALSGLVPHFHGGRFAGRVEVLGLDTRRARPAELAGEVATLFQDPEDQVVMARVVHEVAFGLENLGVPPAEIQGRVTEALDSIGAAHLAGKPTYELSSGELQRVCLAAALALRPRLLLLDEPTSQLDPEGAETLIDLARGQRNRRRRLRAPVSSACSTVSTACSSSSQVGCCSTRSLPPRGAGWPWSGPPGSSFPCRHPPTTTAVPWWQRWKAFPSPTANGRSSRRSTSSSGAGRWWL